MSRGRKSAAALAIVASQIDRRPSPPNELTAAQKLIWSETVRSEAADQFKTAALQQLLKIYCQHVTTADLLSKVIDQVAVGCVGNPEQLRHLNRLLSMRERETKAIADKATKLRLTNQSRY